MWQDKKLYRIIAALAVVVLLVSIGVFPTLTASAEEYNESNPDFQEARIDSDVEVEYNTGVYEQTTEFQQNDGTYNINTDAYVVWHDRDDVAFLYRKYNMSDSRDDVLTIETTVTSQTGNAGLYSTASSGLMIRGSVTDAGSAQVFLHTRAVGVDVVYRPKDGAKTIHLPSGIVPEYPVKLKIEKIGAKYTFYFQNASMKSYYKIGSVGCEMSGPLYAGLASHCSNPKQPIQSVFQGYSAIGVGSYTGTGDDEGSQGPAKPVIKPLDREDPPYTEMTRLYETFSDGSLFDGEKAVNNPIWPETDAEIVTTEDGENRYLLSSYLDETLFLGDQEWTDYTVSMDYQIPEGVSTADNDRLALWTRFKDIDPYGYYGVGFVIETDTITEMVETDAGEVAQLQTTTYLRIYSKAQSSLRGTDQCGTKVDEIEIPSQVGTGWHTLTVDCMDNTFTAYIDGEKLLTYTDDTQSPRLRGQIGIGTNTIEVYLDNIVVTALDDPNGGDYDNYIGGNYEKDIPKYVQDFMKEYEVDY